MPQKVKTEERLSIESLVNKIKKRGHEAYYLPSVVEIIDFIVSRVKQGDQILIMSNGAFDNIHQKLINKLQQNLD